MTARRIAVPEAGLILSDVATANAGTGKHGLLPKRSGSTYDRLNGEGLWLPPNGAQHGLFYSTDCWYQSANDVLPWTEAAIASGTITIANCLANHPGIIYLKSSTSADSGVLIRLGYQNLILAGGESSDAIWTVETTAGTVAAHGFVSSLGKPTVTDSGVRVFINGTTLSGISYAGSTQTNTGTTYTITQGTWYRSRVSIDAAKTVATFSLYTCADGTLVWTDTVTPAAFTPNVLQSTLVVTNSGSSAINLMQLDYINIAIDRVFVR